MADVLLSRRAPWRGIAPRGVVVPLLLIAGWGGTVDTGLIRGPLLVPLTTVLAAPFVDDGGVQIWAALGISLLRMTGGILIGATLGIALALALSLRRAAQIAVSPTVHTLRQITLFAWIPLLTAWFGNGEGSKLVFVALSAFFPTFLNTEQGLRNVPIIYREVADVVRLSTHGRIWRLLLPAALPSILTGLEIALLASWIGTVGAEYAIGSGRGIGAFLAAARELFRMDLVLIGVLLLAAVGYALNLASRALFRSLVPWRPR